MYVKRGRCCAGNVSHSLNWQSGFAIESSVCNMMKVPMQVERVDFVAEEPYHAANLHESTGAHHNNLDLPPRYECLTLVKIYLTTRMSRDTNLMTVWRSWSVTLCLLAAVTCTSSCLRCGTRTPWIRTYPWVPRFDAYHAVLMLILAELHIARTCQIVVENTFRRSRRVPLGAFRYQRKSVNYF